MVQEINYFKFKNFDDDSMRWRIRGCMDACMWFLCRRKGHVNTIILDLRASYGLMLRTDKRGFVQLVGCGALLRKMLTRIDT
jgi:hypothetical protein